MIQKSIQIKPFSQQLSSTRPRQIPPPGTDLALRGSSFSVMTSPMQSIKIEKDGSLLKGMDPVGKVDEMGMIEDT
jgi:hypothetical protein